MQYVLIGTKVLQVMIPITAMIKIGAGSLYLCADKSLRIKSNSPLIVERTWVGAEYT